MINEDIPIHYVESPKSASGRYPYASKINNDYIQSDYSLERKMLILPNPNNGLFKTQVQKLSEEEKLSLRVYDMKGQLMYSMEDIDANQEVNLENCSNGIYLVQVISEAGRSMTKKINVIH